MSTEPVILQIIIHLFNIVIILIATGVISVLVSLPRYKEFKIWALPVAILLAVSLVYRGVFLWDLLDGLSLDPTVYALWSDIIHSMDKITIIIYAATLIAMDKKATKSISEKNKLLDWKPLDKDNP